MPLRQEEADGPLHKLREITNEEAGVLSCKFDVTAEGEAVAPED